MLINTLFSLIILALGVRTLLWHLQNWQLREYRLDRMRARLRTKDGQKDLMSLWFFRGMLPRPKFSKRIILIIGLVGIFSILDLFFYSSKMSGLYWYLSNLLDPRYSLLVTLIIWERFIWLYTAIAVWLTGLIAHYQKKKLFAAAKNVINHSDKNIVRIGITGSYGKSSTKEILVHLLQDHFGVENVLFTPENHNHEIALARLILKEKKFFAPIADNFNNVRANDHSPLQSESVTSLNPKSKILNPQKISIFEMGAYRRGDIRTMCDFVQPQITILTAIGQQHLDLFGSQKNIQLGKFEIAEGSSETAFFNADNPFCQEIFGDKKITATPIGVSAAAVKTKTLPDKTEFHAFGQDFTLPWPGEFFVMNALLALECARELGASPADLVTSLKTLPPLERAMQFEQHAHGFTVIKDLYSSNPTGVKAAIEHLRNFRGKKIFVGIPLLELGKESKKIHAQIFNQLADIKAEVFWMKDDYQSLGQNICTKNWHGSNLTKLKTMLPNLGKDDVVLLEGRLPQEIENMV